MSSVNVSGARTTVPAGFGSTVTSAVPDTPSLVAVTMTGPALPAEATTPLTTVATESFPLDHAIARPVSTAPLESFVISDNLELPPALTHTYCYREGGRCLTKSATNLAGPRRTRWQRRSTLRHAGICSRRFGSGTERAQGREAPHPGRVRRGDRVPSQARHAAVERGHGRGATAGRSRLPLYDEAVREALIVLWEASDRVCGKRLKALAPILVEAMERHGHLQLAPEVRTRLLPMSAATIDRAAPCARGVRPAAGPRRTAPSSAVRRSVPVRTFADWHDPPPGLVEADLVAHSGPSASGSFVQTLVLTDIATGWTECGPLLVREQGLLSAVLEQLRKLLPFDLLGFDTDNDSVFMNETVRGYCQAAGIAFTRCRPYRKNDQAFVEQKNGAVVRRIVGYRRLEGLAAAAALSALRGGAAVRELLPALVQAGRKDARGGEGAQDLPRTRDALREAPGFRRRDRRDEGAAASGGRRTRPVAAAGGNSSHSTPPGGDRGRQHPTCLTFWGQPRRISHGSGYGVATGRSPRHASTRAKAGAGLAYAEGSLRAVWPRVLAWLEAEPDRVGKDLFERLQREQPGVFSDGQLRTFQRRIKEWREAAARQLVFASSQDAA